MSKPFNPLLLTDFYKIEHYRQYPAGTTMVYSNLTARKSRIPGVDKVVFFGLQYFIKEYLIKQFNEGFFNRPKEEVMEEYRRVVKNTIGDLPSYEHIEKLHDLGYLPIRIKALPEGSKVPIRVAMLTIQNTHEEFAWLTNFLESLMSAIIWLPITSATIAYEYKKLFTKYLSETVGDTDFVQWMGHDFSFRGMGGLEAAVTSGMGHLLSFTGTDTIPAILALEEYYGANVEKELVGASVPATEHSVMCAGTGVEGEFETFKRLITKTYPSGIISIVSDTFDLWQVLTVFMPSLKKEILARDGKVVIRPDSGDPVDIICGRNFPVFESVDEVEIAFAHNIVGTVKFQVGEKVYKIISHSGTDFKYEEVAKTFEEKGVIELLWDVFGGTIVNGYKVLNPKVGAIYGDSITIERARQISERLIAKGFAPLLVYGIGSFTYQYNTRDTFGMAVKATAIKMAAYTATDPQERLDDVLIEIFKDPVTDDGTKKSAKGLIQVREVLEADGLGKLHHKTYEMVDQQTEAEEKFGQLKVVYEDGKLLEETSLSEIRKLLK